MVFKKYTRINGKFDYVVYLLGVATFISLSFLYILIWRADQETIQKYDLVVFNSFFDYLLWLLFIIGNISMYFGSPFYSEYPQLGKIGKTVDIAIPTIFLVMLCYFFVRTIKKIGG